MGTIDTNTFYRNILLMPRKQVFSSYPVKKTGSNQQQKLSYEDRFDAVSTTPLILEAHDRITKSYCFVIQSSSSWTKCWSGTHLSGISWFTVICKWCAPMCNATMITTSMINLTVLLSCCPAWTSTCTLSAMMNPSINPGIFSKGEFGLFASIANLPARWFPIRPIKSNMC